MDGDRRIGVVGKEPSAAGLIISDVYGESAFSLRARRAHRDRQTVSRAERQSKTLVLQVSENRAVGSAPGTKAVGQLFRREEPPLQRRARIVNVMQVAVEPALVGTPKNDRQKKWLSALVRSCVFVGGLDGPGFRQCRQEVPRQTHGRVGQGRIRRRLGSKSKRYGKGQTNSRCPYANSAHRCLQSFIAPRSSRGKPRIC